MVNRGVKKANHDPAVAQIEIDIDIDIEKQISPKGPSRQVQDRGGASISIWISISISKDVGGWSKGRQATKINIIINDFPPELHEQLRKNAAQTGRSINEEIIRAVKKIHGDGRHDRNALLRRIRTRRAGLKVWCDDESIRQAIERH